MDFIERIRQTSTPLEPRATEATAVLRELPSIRAVLWDIYGTLVISASGDVGSADAETVAQLRALMRAIGG